MDKLKITDEDLSAPAEGDAGKPGDPTIETFPVKTDELSLRTRALLAPLVMLLPVLCLVTIVGRAAKSAKSNATREAWLKYTGTLLVISSLLTCTMGIVLYARLGRAPANPETAPAPSPAVPSRTLSKLANLPQAIGQPIVAADAQARLKPLVLVITQPGVNPVEALDKLPADKVGTAALLYVNATNALVVTSKHLTPPLGDKAASYLYTDNGHTPTEVVARHNTLDLALLRMKLRGQETLFVQPIRDAAGLADGEVIYSLGHPEGQFFKLTTDAGSPAGANGEMRLKWTVKPGTHGAPIYDSAGRLVAVAAGPQAGQIGASTSALNAALLRDVNGWTFAAGQRRFFDEYIANPKSRSPAQ